MSKKKSYMDKENVLSEGFFDKLKSYFKDQNIDISLNKFTAKDFRK